MKFFLASLAAIVVQPLWFVVWLGVPMVLQGGPTFRLSDVSGFVTMALLAMTVAAPFVLLIGLPSGLILQHARHRGVWLGLIGIAAVALPFAGDVSRELAASWNRPTALIPLLIGGAHGLFGALAFHATLRGFERDAEAVRIP